MSVRHYSELNKDQQKQVLKAIMAAQSVKREVQVHEALLEMKTMVVIVDNYSGKLTTQMLPCNETTYREEQLVITTGKWSII